MSRNIGAWVGIAATFAVVFGGISYAGHTDPEGRVNSPAYGAIHGIVMPPFRG